MPILNYSVIRRTPTQAKKKSPTHRPLGKKSLGHRRFSQPTQGILSRAAAFPTPATDDDITSPSRLFTPSNRPSPAHPSRDFGHISQDGCSRHSDVRFSPRLRVLSLHKSPPKTITNNTFGREFLFALEATFPAKYITIYRFWWPCPVTTHVSNSCVFHAFHCLKSAG